MLKAALLVFAVTALLIGVILVAPYGIDWNRNLRPATLAFLHGENPYNIPEFLNPPWTLVLLAPFALLPEPIGRATLFVVSLALLAVVLQWNKATPLTTALFLSTPMALPPGDPTILSVVNGTGARVWTKIRVAGFLGQPIGTAREMACR